MRATFKLLNSYFWKTIYGPVMAFIIPVILLGILGGIFRIEYVYPGIVAMAFLFIGLLSLPLTIMELKQSSLFKYIGSSPVNPIRFTIVVIFFYIFISLLSGFVIFGFTMAIFSKDVFPSSGFRSGILGGIFTWKGAASFYTATLIHLLFTITTGLLIATFSKTPQQSLTIGLTILIPSMFLSGMILSVDIIAQSKILNWVSRLMPFRYSTGNMIIASTPKPQLGDMFEKLTDDQMSIIFSNYNPLTHTATFSGIPLGKNDMLVHNMDDLSRVRTTLGNQMYASISDRTLFDLTFGVALDSNAAASDNNIFNWVNDWAVLRVPQVDSVKSFITEYFKGYSGGHADWSKLQPIADQIVHGKFGWLEVFMKQTNILYFKADRALNFFVPAVFSGLSIWYMSQNFNWTAR